MPVPTNAYSREDITNQREDIRDVIYDVSPTERPFMSNAPQGTCDNTLHEWIIDELDAPDVTNAWPDGEEFAGGAITSPSKLNNQNQISRKDLIVTRRARKINKAGMRDELARQVVRKGRELARDMESIMLYTPQTAVADTGGTAPLLGNVFAFIVSNANHATTTGVPPADNTSGTTWTDGTLRAGSEADLLGVVKSIYTNASEYPDTILMHEDTKQNFSNYLFDAANNNRRIATPFQDHGASPRGGLTVVGAVDVWVTNFGTVELVCDRFMRSRDVFIQNTGYWDVGYFDAMQTDAMAKTADTDDRMVLADYTVVARNEKSSGAMMDVDPAVAWDYVSTGTAT